MVVIDCPIDACEYKTPDASEAVAVASLQVHAISHQSGGARHRGPKMERPRIDMGVETELWNTFVRRWETFRIGSDIDNIAAPRQLLQCARESLCDVVLKADPLIAEKNTQEVLNVMRAHAVIPVATGVLRTELVQMQQGPDELFRNFAARVRGKAETCGFRSKTTCQCGESVVCDYTDETIRDVLLAGIADIDIRRDALGADDIQQKSINDVIALVENKEKARNALPSASASVPSLSSVSTFKKLNAAQKHDPASTGKQLPAFADRSRTGKCPDCGKSYRLFKESARGWNTKPHGQCLDCFRDRRRRPHGKDCALPPPTGMNALLDTHSPVVAQITSHTTSFPPANGGTRRRRRRKRQCHAQVPLERRIFSAGEWRRAQLTQHPRVNISVSLASGGRNMVAATLAITDTGAQSNLWSRKAFLDAGFSSSDLQPVKLNITAANSSPISIDGAFKAHLRGQAPDGRDVSTTTMVYVSKDVCDFFLSFDTMVDLEIIGKTFPTIGSARSEASVHTTSVSAPLTNSRTSEHSMDCSCPLRKEAPLRPQELPFPCTAENNEKMKEWLVTYFEASTFNTCPHRPLPAMAGPPVEIHLDPNAKPRACHTAASIPLHWQQKVYEDLLRDEALEVIERVPYGEPVNWCHRMVVTRKHDGSPRRTVDLSPLNKFCKRETHAQESPFHLARRVPGHTWKTVTDAWNGYHSVPLRQEDRHLTTFITPFGRWRYARAPQGFLSSGDGYNRRLDAILSNFERKERCVDDTVHYDDDLESHWWRTIDLLRTLGANGVVLNPQKFQFAHREVDFAGFHISESTIEPLAKYLDAIRQFPTPASITDVRSWFGLVNQVTNYAQLRDTMSPFKPLLSPKQKFCWTTELDEAFHESKKAIVDAIRQGVEIFDTTRPTCLRPDWSGQGMGYFLLQKHCSCTSDLPDCCDGGWRITLAGSRFLSSCEQRYAPIEGEASAVAWGLEQTRYFTQGCDDLLVVTDHKPLVKILGDRTLDEIANPRLFRLKLYLGISELHTFLERPTLRPTPHPATYLPLLLQLTLTNQLSWHRFDVKPKRCQLLHGIVSPWRQTPMQPCPSYGTRSSQGSRTVTVSVRASHPFGNIVTAST
jgi:hypothetical protein